MPVCDEELMLRCRDGDVSAFEELMARHLESVTRHVQRMVFDRDAAQDLAQDVFLKVYTRRDTYTGDGRFGAWLRRIATNAAIDHLRRRKKRRFVSLHALTAAADEDEVESELHETIADSGSQQPYEILSTQEDWTRLGSALDLLSDAQRHVFQLRMWEGLDYKAIAERVGCKPETARTRMHAAMQELKRNMGDTIT